MASLSLNFITAVASIGSRYPSKALVRGRHILRENVVLHGDQDPGHGPHRPVPLVPPVDLRGLLQRIFRHVEEALEVGIGSTEEGEVGFGELDGGAASGEEGMAESEDLRGGR